jgi:hypothetical protein
MNVGRFAIEDEELLSMARGRWAAPTWSPHRPFAKQQEWIALDVLESCYGGAAGGGKSDALLASALRFFDTPGYAALLLRRTYSDLALPGAIMSRAHDWLEGSTATWNDRDKRWVSLRGGVLQFGYCDTLSDLQRYKSAEFQFIGIDELTEWPEEWYAFLFSRLRRLQGSRVPLRMRSGTNPDGLGSTWVRERFRIPEGVAIPEPIWSTSSRVFWPARAEDNPALDLPAYEAALEQMTGGRDGVKWKQLREGLWIRDDEGLVYAWQKTRNTAHVDVAKEMATGVPWAFVLGIDYGFDDATAFAVLGWRAHDPTVYVVESSKESGWTPGDAAQHVASLEARYRFTAIIGDTGGLGKGYAEEARKRFGLPIVPAEKHNKRGYIELLNGALRSGQMMVLPGNEDLEHEWATLPWAEGRQKEAPGFANHLADAVLYAWRGSFAYLEQARREQPTRTAEDTAREEEERLAREVDEGLSNRGTRSWARRMASRR